MKLLILDTDIIINPNKIISITLNDDDWGEKSTLLVVEPNQHLVINCPPIDVYARIKAWYETGY